MIEFKYRQFLMCAWVLATRGDSITHWENKFLRSILLQKKIGEKITIKQDMKIFQIYEKNRRPREYYASTYVCPSEYRDNF